MTHRLFTAPLAALTVAFALLSAPLRAGEVEDIAALLRLVGYDASVAAIPSSITHGLDAQGPEAVDPKALEAMKELAPRHFDPEEMFDRVAVRAAGRMTPEEIAALTEFYQDGLGKRATEMETAAQAPGLQAEKEQEGLKIIQKLIDTKDPRLNHYVKIVDALGAIDSATAMGLNLSYAMLSAMVGSPALPQALSDEQILAIVKGQEETIRGRSADRIYIGMAYTYRDMSDADLAAYAAFFERPEAQKFYRVINEASEAELVQRARAFGHDIMTRMGMRKT